SDREKKRKVKLIYCFGRPGIASLIQTSMAEEKTKVGWLFTEEELRQWFFRYMASSYSQPRRINPECGDLIQASQRQP
ncbi:hypothetical protein, partial [Salmonella enterica]|uniref:hypothetical protein n=1 Tax=Salmonella enterica TaxID=28901 RepID=UPI00329A52C7